MRLIFFSDEKPFSKSARISSICSSPTERRMSPGVMPQPPAAVCELAVRGGGRVQHTGANIRHMHHIVGHFQAVHKFHGSLAPPFMENEITPAHPCGRYFSASARYGLPGSVG